MMYYGLLSFPFVVLAIGAVLLLFPKRFRTRRLGISLTIIGGVVSLVITVWIFTFPTSERQAAQERLLFSMSSNQIQSIAIDPKYGDNETYSKNNLVRFSITLTDAEQIKQVIHAIHQARPFSPNHPGAQWSCLLTINSNDDSVSIEVDDTKSQENGVVVYLWSHRTQGWLVANYRCDPLGPVLERVVNKVDANRK
jgi:hypothetical protein